MAAGAGDVQLKLQVSLDTAYIASQLQGLNSLARRQAFNIVPKLDTKKIDAALKSISKQAKININDSQVEAARLRLAKLNRSIATLRRSSSIGDKIEIKVGAKASITQKDARKVRSDIYRGIMEQGGKILLPVGLRPVSQTAVDAFKSDLRQKLGTISVNVKANLESTAMRSGAKSRAEIDAEVSRGLEAISQMGAARMAGGGNVTEGARRESLRKSIEGLTVAQLKQVAKQLEVKGFSGLRRADLINKIVADSSIEMVKRYLDPQAVMRGGDRGQLQKVLDIFARGVFRMLGMDPASIRATTRRALPPVDWPSVAPSRTVNIGPSATGRALPGAPPAAMLPGTRFIDQPRLTGNVLTPTLKEILRGAANAFVDNVRNELNNAVRSVNVRDLGNRIRQALALPGGRVAGLLPPGVGRQPQRYAGLGAEQPSWQERAAARTAQAYARSALRGLDVMYEGGGAGRPPAPYGQAYRSPRPRSAMVPYEAGGALVAPPGGVTPVGPEPLRGQSSQLASPLPSGYLAAGQFAASLKGADQYLRQARVPLAGAIAELGGEFAEATKQVLLYGTAYKALAFFMDLPRQALDAATALQTFRNQLLAVTGSATNANASFSFVDSLAERFAVPLQSVREGFVRLYASMEPAGFKAPEIEGLFSGISKAAATFGMSKEQVDRVTYAFSQMASKGQIMAEELRGQLGDVLPGSLALFAQAAQMSIPEFTKAMEDGRFTGEAMAAVLKNVGVLLNTEFAAGAQGAAKTLRGALNSMQNQLQRLYEAFEPLVNEVARSVFPIISSAIGDATAAVKAFTAAAEGNVGPLNMLSSGARSIYDAMRQVTEVVTAVSSLVVGLAPTLAVVGRSLLLLVEQVAKFINTPLGGFLANWLLQTTLLAAAMQALAKIGLLKALAAIVMFNGGVGEAIRQLKLLIATSATAKLGLIALGGGLVLTALSSLFQSLEGIYNKMLGIQQAAKNSAQAIAGLSQTEATVQARAVENDINTLRRLQQQTQGIKNGMVSATAAEITTMARAGASPGSAFTGQLIDEKQGTYGAGFVDPTQIEAAILKLQDDLARLRAQAKPAGGASLALAPIPPAAVDAEKAANDAEKERAKRERDAERLRSQEQQRILAAQELRSRLGELNFEQTKTLAEKSLDYVKGTIDAEFDYRMAKANEMQSFELRLQKQLSDMRVKSEQAIQDAKLRLQGSSLKVQAATEKAAAAKAADAVETVLPRPGVAIMQGLTGGGQSDASRGRSSGPHLHSQTAPGISQAEHMRMVDAALVFPGGRRASSYGLSRGHARHGYSGLDYLTPQGTPFSLAPGWTGTDMGIQGALGRGMRVSGPGGSFELGHLAGITKGAGPISGTAFATEKREEAAARDLVISKQEDEITKATTLAELHSKLSLATKEASAQIAEAIGTAMPVSQMTLENNLLEQRNKLLLQGASDETIEREEKLAKAKANLLSIQDQLGASIKFAEEDLATYKRQLDQGVISQQFYDIAAGNINKRITTLQDGIAQATTDFDDFNAQLLRTKQINETMEPKLRIATALRDARQELLNLAEPSRRIITIADGISSAFGEAFKGIITGTSSLRDSLAGLFRSISNMFADMVAKMLAEWLKIQVIEKLAGWAGLAPGATQGASVAGSSAAGLFSSALPMLTGAPGLGLGGGFGGGSVASLFSPELPMLKFATGGVVTGPTLGLVGEGRYNEAVVPMPDGKSIPVNLGGAAGNNIATNIVINMGNGQGSGQISGTQGNQLARELEGAVKQVILKETRPGGIIYSQR